jgi:hypothetical protein
VISNSSESPFKNDLFILYATADNQAWASSGPWVDRLRNDLVYRLHMITGEKPRIWLDKLGLQLETAWEEEIDKALLASKLLLAIISPSFLSSDFCKQQLGRFISQSTESRVVQVVKYPPASSLLPNLVEHRFYRTTREAFAQEVSGEQYERAVNELAHQIALLLKGFQVTLRARQDRSNPGQLLVFLCHSSGDKQPVHSLWERLTADGFSPWLDDKDIKPGQQWEVEIRDAIDKSGAIVVCLSKASINKEGFLQREIKLALEKAEEKPDDAIFLIPVRLEECSVPARLGKWQWVNLFEDGGYPKLVQALQIRAQQRLPNM